MNFHSKLTEYQSLEPGQSFYFSKMEGCGNNFIVAAIDPKCISVFTERKIKDLCEVHFGVGSDGLMLIQPSINNEIQVSMYNPDGSPMGMCGNGIRCVALFAETYLGSDSHSFLVDGKTKIICYRSKDEIFANDQAVFKAEMGKSVTGTNSQVNIKDRSFGSTILFDYAQVFMPNPHAVILVDDLPSLEQLAEWGSLIETHENFSKTKTNVEFVQVINEENIKVLVWERGAGITKACGTGACASVVAMKQKNLIKNRCHVELLGGQLLVELNDSNDNVNLIGPCREVFMGQLFL